MNGYAVFFSVEKNFESYPDIAADIINALIYEGRQVIQKEHLIASPTESLYQGSGIICSQLEDVTKYEMRGTPMAFAGSNMMEKHPKPIYQ